MLHETFILSERYPDATLTTYVSYDPPSLKMPPRPAIVVCPGGGYSMLSDREAEPIVKEFLAAGLNAFLLRYTVKEGAANYAPLIQASLAIKHIRENAEKYHIDPNRVFIVGFSAGGHLAASTGILWNIPEVREALGDAPEGINKPTGMILSYPVITGYEFAHRNSINHLCGKKDNTDEEIRRFSLEYHVDETTVPAFIWHTFEDAGVNVINSLSYATRLREKGVSVELHAYPYGRHGLGLAEDVPHTCNWSEELIGWIALQEDRIEE